MITPSKAPDNATLPPAQLRLIIRRVIRRLYVTSVFVGDVPLDADQARHAYDVLRLTEGTPVEVFDNQGQSATGTLVFAGSRQAAVRVERLTQTQAPPGPRVIVAAATPKGERADWMVEKLSELGVLAFVPLAAQRSVVKPGAGNKFDRWRRLAVESAKQSRRAGVMRIEEFISPASLIEKWTKEGSAKMLVLSTRPGAEPIARVLSSRPATILLLIGPEGGWTEAEMELFITAGAIETGLTRTILRIETAAVAAAVASLCFAGEVFS